MRTDEDRVFQDNHLTIAPAARMAGNGVPVLLITANVGSIFEEVRTHYNSVRPARRGQPCYQRSIALVDFVRLFVRATHDLLVAVITAAAVTALLVLTVALPRLARISYIRIYTYVRYVAHVPSNRFSAVWFVVTRADGTRESRSVARFEDPFYFSRFLSKSSFSSFCISYTSF